MYKILSIRGEGHELYSRLRVIANIVENDISCNSFKKVNILFAGDAL